MGIGRGSILNCAKIPATGRGVSTPDGLVISNWTQQDINTNCLFFASHPTDLLSKVVATQLPNQVTGATDYLTVTGVGLDARYRTPDNATYRTADSDYVFWKTDASESICDGNRLIAYDFPRILVKYLDVSPYTILWIAILKPGVTVTDKMYSAFHLPTFWSGVLNLAGYIKQNRPIAQQYVWTAESVYEAESEALFTRMTAVSETPDSTRKGVINTAIAADKTDIGFTGQYDAFWLLAAHGNDSALLNIIKDEHNTTLVGTTAFEIDRGYTGASGKALDCNYNPSTDAIKYLQDASSIGIYIRTNVDELAHDFDCEGSEDHGSLFISRLTNAKYFAINGAAFTTNANTDSRGMWILVRENATTIRCYKDGVSTETFAQNSEALANETWSLLCRKIGATRDRYSTKQIALHFIGGILDQTKVTSFQTIWVDGYLNSVGAKV